MTDRVLLSLMVCASFLLSCGKEGTSDKTDGDKDVVAEVTEVTKVTSSISINLSTDKALYSPGETVRFHADNIPSGAKIRYRHGFDVVATGAASGNDWEWTAPEKDFTGYLVDVFTTRNDGTEVIYGTIALDVSSDWTVYPRYGFVGDFGRDKLSEGVIESEMEFLCRCHINGVQFYDWHNKHHWPLGGTVGSLDEIYKDIANRDVYTEAVKKYISVQHSMGMKSMFYNLCFGALDDAAADGVKDEWYIFKGQGHTDRDFHGLPASWKSSIYVLDPGNQEWQAYIAERNREVYDSFDFDGFHIDQLGDRGTRYDWDGNALNLPKAYASFIDAMKKADPDKYLVMNSVSSYGASQIAGTGKVGFLYNELWGSEASFKSLYNVIKANDTYSDGKLKTVLAAYMNYNCDNREFNTPGVLLADAVMFALGGSHLELGDHMLCREYFPYQGVRMSEALRTMIVRYYDFMTAYENLLRQEGTAAEMKVDMSCTSGSKNVKMAYWPPQASRVVTFGKQTGGRKVVHLLNFLSAENLDWRDTDGNTPEPRLVNELPVEMKVSGKINRIWAASPDFHAGAPVELAFRQTSGSVVFTVPSLKYWTMIVIE